MSSRKRSQATLGQGIDREVHQAVQQIVEVQGLVSAATVYQLISQSNTSLSRRPKQVLESSINRVLEKMNQQSSRPSSHADSEEQRHHGEGASLTQSDDRLPSRALNKSITARFDTSHQPSSTITHNNRAQSLVPRQGTGEPPVKKRRTVAANVINTSPPTHISLKDLAGIEHIIRRLRGFIMTPMKNLYIYQSNKFRPARSVLISGPKGSGKTSLVHAFAAALNVSFVSIPAAALLGGIVGESDRIIREHFEEAKKCAPCLVFIDQIDAISSTKDSGSGSMGMRTATQISQCMDVLSMRQTDGKPVILLATARHPENLDAGLRQIFQREIQMGIPTELDRKKMLLCLTRDYALSTDVDFDLLAKRTPGYVGADLDALVQEACASAIERYQARTQTAAETSEIAAPMDLDESSIAGATTWQPEPAALETQCLIKYIEEHSHHDRDVILTLLLDDFLTALPRTKAAALSEGFTTVPTATFASIGALTSHIEVFKSTIIKPILDPNRLPKVGVKSNSGALLWGPPGNGKTLLAQAVANASHANFISVKGAELLNKYVGESERAVRQIFSRARNSAPVIIFLDEIDALAPKRDSAVSEVSSRVVAALLTELDGVGGSNESVYVIAATNRPDIIDSALVRPGRLDTKLYIGLPDAEGRVDILKTLCKVLPGFTFDESVAELARKCVGFSGADLMAVRQQAGYAALKRCEDLSDAEVGVIPADFEVGRTKVTRSVSEKEARRFDGLRREWDTMTQ